MTADEQGTDTDLSAEIRAHYGINADEEPPNRHDIHANDMAAVLDELDAARTERDTALAEISRWPFDWETRFLCDGFCTDAPEEDCSRHGRKPADIWRIVTEVQAQRDTALAELAELRCTANILAAQRDDAQVDCEFAQAAVVTEASRHAGCQKATDDAVAYARRDAWDEGYKAADAYWVAANANRVPAQETDVEVNPYRARASTQTPAAPAEVFCRRCNEVRQPCQACRPATGGGTDG